jgi:hypothetical protein
MEDHGAETWHDVAQPQDHAQHQKYTCYVWLMTRVARGFIVMAVFSFRCIVGRCQVRAVTKALQPGKFAS